LQASWVYFSHFEYTQQKLNLFSSGSSGPVFSHAWERGGALFFWRSPFSWTACAWQMIYDRLSAWGQLDKMEDIIPEKDWSKSLSGGPRRFKVGSSEKATEKAIEKSSTRQ
jgi:hypothetical protein